METRKLYSTYYNRADYTALDIRVEYAEGTVLESEVDPGKRIALCPVHKHYRNN